MKTALRIAIGVVTAPIWITGGLIALLAFSPWIIAAGLFALIDFAITGEWEL
jgi:hypothetical protein